MKTLIAVLSLAVVCTSLEASADATREVLVLTTVTEIAPTIDTRKAVELQNLGPNSIFCAIGKSANAVLNKAREIPSGGSWALALAGNIKLYCRAATADQATGAATIVTELP